MKIILLCAGLLIAGNSFAQNINSELYQYNYTFLNPAFTGSTPQAGAMLNDAKYGSYNRFRGLAFAEGFIKKMNTGIGWVSYGDVYGPESLSSHGLLVNHQFLKNSNVRVKLGTKAYYQQYSIDFDLYLPGHPDDPLIDKSGLESAGRFLMDFGGIVEWKDFYAGATILNLFNTSLSKGMGPRIPKKTERDFNSVIGFKRKHSTHLASDHSAFIYYANGAFSFADLNNAVTINDWLIIGITYRAEEEGGLFKVNTGVKIKEAAKLILSVYSQSHDRDKPDFKGEVLLMIQL